MRSNIGKTEIVVTRDEYQRALDMEEAARAWSEKCTRVFQKYQGLYAYIEAKGLYDDYKRWLLEEFDPEDY